MIYNGIQLFLFLLNFFSTSRTNSFSFFSLGKSNGRKPQNPRRPPVGVGHDGAGLGGRSFLPDVVADIGVPTFVPDFGAVLPALGSAASSERTNCSPSWMRLARSRQQGAGARVPNGFVAFRSHLGQELLNLEIACEVWCPTQEAQVVQHAEGVQATDTSRGVRHLSQLPSPSLGFGLHVKCRDPAWRPCRGKPRPRCTGPPRKALRAPAVCLTAGQVCARGGRRSCPAPVVPGSHRAAALLQN